MSNMSARLMLRAPQRSTAAVARIGVRHYSAPVTGSIPAAKKKYVPTEGVYPKGFRVSGTIVGVKPNNTTKPDLAFITSDTPCAAAAVFTKNKFQAAPVTFSRALLQRQKNSGLRGVIINSGCANAVTGRGGLEDAEAMAKEADKSLGASNATIVMSTGVIGQRYVIENIYTYRILAVVLDADYCPGYQYKRSLATFRRHMAAWATPTSTGCRVQQQSAPPTPSPNSCLGPLVSHRLRPPSTGSPV